MFAKILLPSDGSESALSAAGAAALLAQKFGSTVTILHVFSLPTSSAPIIGAPGIDLDAATVNKFAEEVHDAVARRTGKVLEDHGITYTVEQEIGHPAETIVHMAERGGYDLIVIGSRGLSEIKSFFLGSTSDKVSHHAHCPVLIVK